MKLNKAGERVSRELGFWLRWLVTTAVLVPCGIAVLLFRGGNYLLSAIFGK
ncbi:hypothetical protein [Hufsiella ginkgonis]|uniref:Uncharacterized protein n=1 Tax=Hufsiella ginkgonis TaxID=2695274 RepID=A0A7K1Y0M1_9SPHI|nr:hypothetical protein [Hufsiella ginkgonis]MXV16752.1 hypothetical protein [Hufsiella ginkgonis]